MKVPESLQLALCVLAVSYYTQLGNSQSDGGNGSTCDVENLRGAVVQSLLPILKSIKNEIVSVKEDMSILNQTVSYLNMSLSKQSESLSESLRNLSVEFELHQSQTTSTLNNLESLKDNGLDVYSSNDPYRCDREYHLNLNDSTCDPYHTCGGSGGWRRVVYMDMTDNKTYCPKGWNMTGYPKKTCGRATNIPSGGGTCDSAIFPVCGGEYNQVCGRIKAYQWGMPNGFIGSIYGATIEKPYFSGIAVMHGCPRQHIWSFIVGGAEDNGESLSSCPCDAASTNSISVPHFVGEDYFCESGLIYPAGQVAWRVKSMARKLHYNDILWDGRDCQPSSRCCSWNNPPFFTKTLGLPTTDDIELRMCFSNSLISENLAVEFMEMYVK